MHLKYSFPEKKCVIIVQFLHEIRSFRLHCKFSAWKSLAISLAKNEFSMNFKSRVCRTNRKPDIEEYSRTFEKIVNFTSQSSV